MKINFIQNNTVIHMIEECQFEDNQHVIDIPGYPSILICFSQNQYFAVENKCPHQQRELFGGCIHEGYITCPYHGLKLNLSDGASVDSKVRKNIRIFSTSMMGNMLNVFL